MKKQNWKPADKFKVKKLRRAGPKKGQSVDAYMYGRTKGKNYENPNELTQSKTTN